MSVVVFASLCALTAYEPGFVWGAAMSAHQAEGLWGKGEASDWYRFEHQTPSPIKDGDTADRAVDFWHRYDEDFAAAAGLGLDSVRISIAWEKVEPAPGQFDAEVLEHYRTILKAMRARGLRPMVAFHHFTHPLWFVERGGWTAPGAAAWFVRYAERVFFALRDLCDLWITFNEPSVLVNLGFVKGTYPPNLRSPWAAVLAAFNLARAHQAVVAWIHRWQPPKREGLHGVGLVNSLQLYRGRFAWVVDALANWAYLHLALERRLTDEPAQTAWIGVNYYGVFNFPPRCDGDVADNGWCLDPDGLETILTETARRFSLPLIVGENGLADASDRLRPQIIRRSLAALDRAKAKGLDVRGYYHWTLTDNFEWLHGYTQRFGLLDLERKPRPSAAVYREEIHRRR